MSDALLAAESAAGIAETVFSGPEGYNLLYQAIATRVNGFTGIWNIIAQCGVEVARLEDQDPEMWAKYEWIELCSEIGGLILGLTAPPDDIPGLVASAIGALKPSPSVN
jgi:hypothetical protein